MPVQEEDQTKGALDTLAPSKTTVNVTGVGKVPLQTAVGPELLKNLEAMIAERESTKTGVLTPFLEGLKDAAAFTARDPSSALAQRDAEKRAQQESLFGMRNQLATLKQAQAQQNQFNQLQSQRFGGGAPGAGAGAGSGAGAGAMQPGYVNIGGVSVPQAYAIALQGARSQEEFDQIWNAKVLPFVQKMEEVGQNPEMDKPTVPVVERLPDGSYRHNTVSVREYRAAPPGKYSDTPSTQGAVQQQPQQSNVPTTPLKNAIRGQESGDRHYDAKGNVLTSVDNAVGIGQITPDTFDRFKNIGVIPRNYDIKDPTNNKDASERIIDYYSKKYNDDPRKVAAAYFGGEGAVNPDGSINVNRKDSTGKTIGSYVNDVVARMSNGVTPTASPFNIRPTAEELATQQDIAKKRAEIEMQTKADIEKSVAGKRGELDEKDRAAFRTSTEPSVVDQQRSIGAAIQEKITKNPRLAGVFADPGVINAAGALLGTGVELGRLGTLRLNLEDAYLQAFDKKYGKPDVAEREAIKNMFANLELAKSQLIKGEGPISDNERALLQRATGSLSNKAETVIKTAKALQLGAEFKETARNMYDDNRDKYKSFEDFYASKDYKQLVKNFGARADELNREKIDLNAKPNPNAYSDASKEAKYQEYLKSRKVK